MDPGGPSEGQRIGKSLWWVKRPHLTRPGIYKEKRAQGRSPGAGSWRRRGPHRLATPKRVRQDFPNNIFQNYYHRNCWVLLIALYKLCFHKSPLSVWAVFRYLFIYKYAMGYWILHVGNSVSDSFVNYYIRQILCTCTSMYWKSLSNK